MRRTLAFLALLPGCSLSESVRDVRDDGSLAAEGILVDGLQQGTWTYYWPNGKPKARGDYAADEQVEAVRAEVHGGERLVARHRRDGNTGKLESSLP